MIRKAFRMSVNQGREGEDQRRHNPILGLNSKRRSSATASGRIRSTSIRIRSTCSATPRLRARSSGQRIAHTDVCRQWWRFMKDLMPANADASPVSRDLREVFHIEGPKV